MLRSAGGGGSGGRTGPVDAVIVGAGPGGLAAAAAVAAAGRRVVVLDQDRHPGGTTHLFRREGYVFPAGPLSFTLPGFVAGVLRDLGAAEPVTFERDVFQVLRGGLDEVISVPLAQLASRLARQYPDEAGGIRDVVSELEVLGRERASAGLDGSGHLAARVREPARGLVGRKLRSPALRDLLGGQGTAEPVMPVGLLARMWHYMAEAGIWYPRAGIGAVPRLLAERVQDLGGEVGTSERAEELLMGGGRVAGIRTNRRTIRTPWVVAACDQRRFFAEVVPEGIGRDRRALVERMPLSGSALTVFLGVDASKVDLSRFRGHHLITRLSEDAPVPWSARRPVPADYRGDELWLSWWSRHDERLAPKGKEALLIRVAAPYEIFAPLEGPGPRRHAPEYYRAKEAHSRALVGAAGRVLPGLAEAIEVRETATPLTYRFWGHRSEGSIAGWSWWAGAGDGIGRSLVETPVPGLLTSGIQAATSLVRGGVGTSLLTGLRAAEAILEEDDGA